MLRIVEQAEHESSDLPVCLRVGPAERFQKLAGSWKSAVQFLSDTNDICTHPAYQEIIGMGPVALPYIFAELKREPGQWFWALKAITGEDPVPGQHLGNLDLMAKDWLAWAEGRSSILPLVQNIL
jgi:hypothetical protein